MGYCTGEPDFGVPRKARGWVESGGVEELREVDVPTCKSDPTTCGKYATHCTIHATALVHEPA